MLYQCIIISVHTHLSSNRLYSIAIKLIFRINVSFRQRLFYNLKIMRRDSSVPSRSLTLNCLFENQ